MSKKRTFRHLSLFSGCGGMDIGLQGGFKIQTEFIDPQKKTKWTNIPKTMFETVFANDLKKESYNFWLKNLLKDESIFHLGSIVDLVKEHKKKGGIFPKNIDIVTGGFPCQDFSVSGLRKGFISHKSHLNKVEKVKKNETRGKLYLWMKEVIQITKPKIFIAENVKGLVNMQGVLDIIKKDFKETGSGYRIFTKEFFAPDYGIPQSRKRIFIIGVSENFIKKFKIPITSEDLFPEIIFTPKPDMFIKYKYPKARIFFRDLKEPENEKNDLSQIYFSKAKFNKGTQGQTEVYEDGIAPTIRSEHHGNIEFRYLYKKNGGKNSIINKQRRLTVRECARIQTFPDHLDFIFGLRDKKGVSASAAYKLIGDAVPPLLAYKILFKIEKLLVRYL
jgi:DNA (cytosine-5)-methyltransferase 1